MKTNENAMPRDQACCRRGFLAAAGGALAAASAATAGVLPGLAAPTRAAGVADLRLVPFPKQADLQPGGFPLSEKLVLQAPAADAELLGRLIGGELRRGGLSAPEVRAAEGKDQVFRLTADGEQQKPSIRFRDGATAEDYALVVRPEGAYATAPGREGLFYAAQTLCQLIRGNRGPGGIPCLTIHDWPSLRWRCFLDDMTRGPAATLDTLRREVDLGAALKMNLFTYYMEHQFAFKKHPAIGPKDGSLEPRELAALVSYAKPLGMDILGNQQSFGHFGAILAHPEFAAARETGDVLSPVKEETYKLLDDIYSEELPLLPFPWFNVCCDETYGLGSGPSKELAAKIGVGGVYVQHVRRIHDLLKNKYQKRMMIWGDIILQHPGKLDQIPKDTIMLTWGYDPRASFDDQIVPFVRSGYEFFVCPGVDDWSRILPNFGGATVNIRNFVRDGVKHHALGMLNTDWKDDGESLRGCNWHGYAWGAECAWNASKTPPEVFNRRLGGVLFGEKGDHFGQAIDLLARTHQLPGMNGMTNGRFWQNDFPPGGDPAAVRTSARRLLAIVRPAIEHLEVCKKEAVANAGLLDSFLLGARRMERIGQRMLDGLAGAEVYREACTAAGQETVLRLLGTVEELVRSNREAHATLGREFERLWRAESKPYSLKSVMDRYAGVAARFDDLTRRLAGARRKAEAGQPLPSPEEVGMDLPQGFVRRTQAQKFIPGPLEPEAAWAEPAATHRLGLTVRAGSVERFDVPIELDVTLPDGLVAEPVRAFRLTAGAAPGEVLAQLDPLGPPGKARLVLLLPGGLAKGAAATVHVYLGLSHSPPASPQAASTTPGPKGMKWIENNYVRLLLGPEGGHLYRWEVKALDNRNLTMPGETGWAGFADTGGDHRNSPNELLCTARGPALVRYVSTDKLGLVKTISLFGGVSWVEVVLSDPSGYYWDFDNPKNFAADGPTPGKYLFSNGATGALAKEADGVEAQVKADGVSWAVKFNRRKLAIGMVTPEVAARLVVAPGSGAGGVGVESGPPTAHFITYAGPLAAEPAGTMNRLQQTLDFRNQPDVVLHGVQARRAMP
jgi:hypothetical protein